MTSTPEKSKSPSPPDSPKSPKSAASPQDSSLLPSSHWFNTAIPEPDLPDDNDNADADSAIGSAGGSSTQSLTSSILAYRTINGRRYHSERGNAQYWASNDAQQSDAQDMNHHLLLLAFKNKLYKPPLKPDIKRCLDVGTGTGLWAIDFADEFPNCEVIATDISPIQPSWVPPNLKLEIEDFTLDWTYPDSSFDFIHARLLYGSVPDWDRLFRQTHRACKPGGWVQSTEASPCFHSDDGTVEPGSALHEWGKFFIEGGRIIGSTFEILENNLQQQGMERAGFVDMHIEEIKIPVGPWPSNPELKQLGQFAKASVETDYEGYVSYMAKLTQDWGRDEVLVYCAHVRSEMASGKRHPFFRLRTVWGRKPE